MAPSLGEGPPANNDNRLEDQKMVNALYSARAIRVEHVTIRSTKPFEDVRAKLATLVPRIDDGIFALLRYGESTRALRELEACPPLTIFGQRDHGASWLLLG
jgi:hypothetical protein